MEQYLNIITRRNIDIPQYVREKFPDIMVALQGYHYDNYICPLFRTIDANEIATLNKAMQENKILQYNFSVLPEININVAITYKQWMQFQNVAQDGVDAAWEGDYEKFAASIMSAHIKTYTKANIIKQERRIKREKERLMQEREMNMQGVPLSRRAIVGHESEKPMTDKEWYERLSHLQSIPVKDRTPDETSELNNLLRINRNRAQRRE